MQKRLHTELQNFSDSFGIVPLIEGCINPGVRNYIEFYISNHSNDTILLNTWALSLDSITDMNGNLLQPFSLVAPRIPLDIPKIIKINPHTNRIINFPTNFFRRFFLEPSSKYTLYSSYNIKKEDKLRSRSLAKVELPHLIFFTCKYNINLGTWDGAIVNNKVLVDQQNPFIGQKNVTDCVGACGESATNGNITQNQIRNAVAPGSDPNTVGLGDGYAVRYISQESGGSVERMGQISQSGLIDRMKGGAKVFANLNSFLRHEVLINKVVQRTITKINGRVIIKFLNYAMDPMASQYTFLNNNFLNTSNFWLWYP